MEEVELAVALARRDFGATVARVVRISLQYPNLKHGELVSRCGVGEGAIGPRAVDDSVAVLMMHGIMYAEAKTPSALAKPEESRSLNPRKPVKSEENGEMNGKSPKPVKAEAKQLPKGSVLMYNIRADRLVRRVRIPRQLWLLERLAGSHARTIGMLLFKHGRMSAKTVCEHVSRSGGDDETMSAIEDTMVVLVKGGSMRHAGTVSGGMLGSKTVLVNDEAYVYQQNVAQTDEGDDPDGSGDQFEQQHAKEVALASLTPDERNQTLPVFNRETGKVVTGQGDRRHFVNAPVRTNSNDLWEISSWFLDRVLRNHTCQKVVTVLLGESSESHVPRVYRCGLNVAIEMDDPETTTDETETNPVLFDDLREELDRGGLSEMGQQEFQDALQKLLDLKPIMARVPALHNQTSIVFCPAQAVFLSRQGTVDATLRHMFGLHGLRVWRVLANEGCMQEQMISDKLLMSIKDVRIILFELLSEGYVATQEVPRSNEPSRQDRSSGVWYLWRADVKTTHRRVLEKALHATLRHLLKAESLRNSVLPSEPDAEKKRETKLQVLESSISRLDNLIILFRDFGPLDDRYYNHFYNTLEDDYY